MSKSYLVFELQPNENRKTDRYNVLNTEGQSLGRICWYTNWRRYVFQAMSNQILLFDSLCLEELKLFLDKIMDERKKNT